MQRQQLQRYHRHLLLLEGFRPIQCRRHQTRKALMIFVELSSISVLSPVFPTSSLNERSRKGSSTLRQHPSAFFLYFHNQRMSRNIRHYSLRPLDHHSHLHPFQSFQHQYSPHHGRSLVDSRPAQWMLSSMKSTKNSSIHSFEKRRTVFMSKFAGCFVEH